MHVLQYFTTELHFQLGFVMRQDLRKLENIGIMKCPQKHP
jgi:hypothetical protein